MSITKPIGTLKVLSGDPEYFFNVGGQLDAQEEMTVQVIGGPFDGQTIRMKALKFNCGATGEEAEVQGGPFYYSAMYGCPSHQREEAGDERLADLFTLAYVLAK